MVQLHNKRCLENIDLSLHPTCIQQAREQAIKLQLTDNWAETLNQLNKFSTEFRLLVWHFWELDTSGETDFITSPAETSVLHHLEIAH